VTTACACLTSPYATTPGCLRLVACSASRSAFAFHDVCQAPIRRSLHTSRNGRVPFDSHARLAGASRNGDLRDGAHLGQRTLTPLHPRAQATPEHASATACPAAGAGEPGPAPSASVVADERVAAVVAALRLAQPVSGAGARTAGEAAPLAPAAAPAMRSAAAVPHLQVRLQDNAPACLDHGPPTPPQPALRLPPAAPAAPHAAGAPRAASLPREGAGALAGAAPDLAPAGAGPAAAAAARTARAGSYDMLQAELNKCLLLPRRHSEVALGEVAQELRRCRTLPRSLCEARPLRTCCAPTRGAGPSSGMCSAQAGAPASGTKDRASMLRRVSCSSTNLLRAQAHWLDGGTGLEDFGACSGDACATGTERVSTSSLSSTADSCASAGSGIGAGAGAVAAGAVAAARRGRAGARGSRGGFRKAMDTHEEHDARAAGAALQRPQSAPPGALPRAPAASMQRACVLLCVKNARAMVLGRAHKVPVLWHSQLVHRSATPRRAGPGR